MNIPAIIIGIAVAITIICYMEQKKQLKEKGKLKNEEKNEIKSTYGRNDN